MVDPLTGTQTTRFFHYLNRGWMEYHKAGSGNGFANPETRTVLQPAHPLGCLIAADAPATGFGAFALASVTGTARSATAYLAPYTVETTSWTAGGEPALPFAEEWDPAHSPTTAQHRARPAVVRRSANEFLVAWTKPRWAIVGGTLHGYHRVRAFRYTATTGTAAQILDAEGLLYTAADFGQTGGIESRGVDDTSTLLTYDPVSRELVIWGQNGNSAFVYNTGVMRATYRARFGRLGQDAVMGLAAVVRDVCRRAGLGDGDLDVSALTPSVRGYAVGRPATARQVLDGLRQGFLFDGVESDGRLVFRLRGGEPVATLTEQDLAASTAPVGAETEPRLTETRAQEVEPPRRITVRYPDPALDHQPGSQVAQRASPAIRAGTEEILDTAIVFTAEEAKALAERHLQLAWIGRTRYDWAVPLPQVRLDPTDVLLIQLGEVQHRVLVQGVDLGADGVVKMRGVADQPYAVVPIARPAAAFGTVPQTALVYGDVALLVLNAPLLAETDDTYGYYVAAGRGAPDDAWSGAIVHGSADGARYGVVATVSAPAAMGVTTTALPDVARPQLWDETSTVRVTLTSGALAGADEAAVQAGANWALIGGELVAFRTATLVAANTYDLGLFLRGRQGTEWATGTHAEGERFVLLARDGSVRSVTMPSGDVGATRSFKALRPGQALEDVDAQTATLTARRLKPLSPVHIAGSRNASNDLTVTWVRRARIGAWRDGMEVPLDEPVEAYEVEVVGADPPLVKTASSPTVTLTAAELSAAGLDPAGPVTVRIYQMSSRVGRGVPGEATV